MLETIDLCKSYRPKKGVPVKAIDHVSIRFPEHGMVFLLGKSGSGKSTLLNLLGGLDRCDFGEILINGASSRSFNQQHFDSYRNTYLGFIFQEYNVLEEFTVGANIALAIELQGRKATDEQISAILHEVDLDGYGARRPNELSGGQKQRVAIARALVKNPQIIMADEPTGALDSNTGRQVFDTLKKLSADKLVIVVSHDREFAEGYADRIIELADGHIISDVELADEPAVEESCDGLKYTDNTIEVPEGYHLTEEDRTAINAYLDTLKGSVSIRPAHKTAGNRFRATDTKAIPATTDSGFHLIRSRLPMRSAVRIGAGSLKHKKVRLIVTILLSCIAFGLFGLVDTFSAYDHVRTCTKSIIDSGIPYATLEKTYKRSENYYSGGQHVSDADLDTINKDTGIPMVGVFSPSMWSTGFTAQYDDSVALTETNYSVYAESISGFATCGKEDLDRMGYRLLAGSLPSGNEDEIAITNYVLQTFLKAGYADGTTYVNDKGQTVPHYESISSASDMLGKTLVLGAHKFTVTGVVDTHLDVSRYEYLAVKQENVSTAQELLNMAMSSELGYAQGYSLHQVAFVGKGCLKKLMDEEPPTREINRGWIYLRTEVGGDYYTLDPSRMGTISDIGADKVEWLGTPRTSLGDKEVIVSLDMLQYYLGNENSAKIKEGFAVTSSEAEAVGKSSVTADDIRAFLNRCGSFTRDGGLYSEEKPASEDGYSVVGYIDTGVYPLYANTMITSDALCSAYTEERDNVYSMAVGKMPEERSEVQQLVSYCNDSTAATRYELQNSVTYELGIINEILTELSKIFLYVGIGFAVFASLMLANFISQSIAYKKQEIGILRAIGSRSNDVFRIFFSESFIIAMTNFLLSAAGVGVATVFINQAIRSRLNILISVLSFGPRQILLLLAVSVAVAALASFFPVRSIASKKPIDAIRDR